MNQQQALIDLILLATAGAMSISFTIIMILGQLTLGSLNLIVIGVACFHLYHHRSSQARDAR